MSHHTKCHDPVLLPEWANSVEYARYFYCVVRMNWQCLQKLPENLGRTQIHAIVDEMISHANCQRLCLRRGKNNNILQLFGFPWFIFSSCIWTHSFKFIDENGWPNNTFFSYFISPLVIIIVYCFNLTINLEERKKNGSNRFICIFSLTWENIQFRDLINIFTLKFVVRKKQLVWQYLFRFPQKKKDLLTASFKWFIHRIVAIYWKREREKNNKFSLIFLFFR